ncbi:MAG: penicillin-binding protein 2 [Anaerolineales bacterium]|nr:penicillin-binding protein 2 [Anaerolineales bacterium]
MNNPDSFRRFAMLGIVLLALPILIVLQLVRIQISPIIGGILPPGHEELRTEYRRIIPARGQIYDRWGNILAANKTVYQVGVELRYVRNAQTIAQTLSAVLGVDYDFVLQEASKEATDQMIHRQIADYVTQEQVDKLQMLIDQMEEAFGDSRSKDAPSLRGVVYSPHLARTYPEKSLGSNILGFVNQDNAGYFGVESQYHSLLAGVSKNVFIPLNPVVSRPAPVIPQGASLILTFDREIQKVMEELADQALIETGAQSATIIVLDPKTGEIMAMATNPRLDLNEYKRYNEVFTNGTPFNRAVSQTYEPGSVYKVLTMASALDAGAVTPDTIFVDTGVVEIGGTRIYNWNMGAWGPQDMQGCMGHSLNVCLASIAIKLGPDSFYQYMKAFGIGRMSGIDLAGEAAGRLKTPGDEDWYDAELGVNAFGQGVAVTPLQLAIAISAVANDGKIMAPHVVRSVIDDGHQNDLEIRVSAMPIKAETARTLTDMLARSLEVESSDALVTGYRIAGKTGTAEIPTPLGYTSNLTNASFVGWGPVDDPQFLVYVWLEKPTSSPWGSEVAAPLFRKIVEKLVVLIDLPPDEVRLKLLKP